MLFNLGICVSHVCGWWLTLYEVVALWGGVWGFTVGWVWLLIFCGGFAY